MQHFTNFSGHVCGPVRTGSDGRVGHVVVAGGFYSQKDHDTPWPQGYDYYTPMETVEIFDVQLQSWSAGLTYRYPVISYDTLLIL